MDVTHIYIYRVQITVTKVPKIGNVLEICLWVNVT